MFKNWIHFSFNFFFLVPWTKQHACLYIRNEYPRGFCVKYPGRVAQGHKFAALMKKRKEEILRNKEQSTIQSTEQSSVQSTVQYTVQSTEQPSV